MLNAYHCSNPFSSFFMEENNRLLLFYALGPFRDLLYAPLEKNAVAILEEDGDTLFCHELLGQWAGDLEKTLNQLARPHTRRIGLGFTPKDKLPGMTWQLGRGASFRLVRKGKSLCRAKTVFSSRFRMHKKDLASPKRRVFPQKSSFPAIDIRPFSLVKPQKIPRLCPAGAPLAGSP